MQFKTLFITIHFIRNLAIKLDSIEFLNAYLKIK